MNPPQPHPRLPHPKQTNQPTNPPTKDHRQHTKTDDWFGGRGVAEDKRACPSLWRRRAKVFKPRRSPAIGNPLHSHNHSRYSRNAAQ
ncbi:hypothetical protein Pmani_039135 [Petrolisthes manimaculis]|uniref:Uncharacterized protein n=1 Tax=Petrolisthes manimaculis TaxID=1843537 RepID=A0AAE1TJS0_9EUCA|nr:hypothetical protein Pmani_039135 [Petrolisthes manimaculis]